MLGSCPDHLPWPLQGPAWAPGREQSSQVILSHSPTFNPTQPRVDPRTHLSSHVLLTAAPSMAVLVRQVRKPRHQKAK